MNGFEATITPEKIQEVLEEVLKKNNFKEPTSDMIRLSTSDFIESGLSGELTGKTWSIRYAEMHNYYFHKYLDEADDLGFELNPLEPKAVRKVLNSNRRSVSEKRNRYASIVSYLKFLILQGKLSESRLEAIRKLKPQRNVPVRKRFITRDEIDKILDYVKLCKFTSGYDKAVFETVIESEDELGLRINELCSIQVNHIDFENQELFIPKAKGNREFTKGISGKLKLLWESYLKIRPKTESLNLFVLDNGKPLKRDALIQRFRRVTKKLGLDTSFHAFRRRYITRHLQDGKSLVDVSLAVNHASPRMTEQYLLPDVRKSIEEQKKW